MAAAGDENDGGNAEERHEPQVLYFKCSETRVRPNLHQGVVPHAAARSAAVDSPAKTGRRRRRRCALLHSINPEQNPVRGLQVPPVIRRVLEKRGWKECRILFLDPRFSPVVPFSVYRLTGRWLPLLTVINLNN